MAARMGLAAAMFVRFRRTPRRLQASVVETRRRAGKVASEHVASLGSICAADDGPWPAGLLGVPVGGLAGLSDRIGADDQARIRKAVHGRIPMVPPDEAARW
jgi:hypothetical protein